jgi:hypothetical protein
LTSIWRGSNLPPRFNPHHHAVAGVPADLWISLEVGVSMHRVLTLLVMCCLSAARAASGQAISVTQVQGTVQDSTGAMLPGVTVTMTQTATGLVRTTTSGTDGRYLLPALPVGPYRLEAVLDGFRTYTQTGIVLQVNVNPTINVTMEIGAVSEVVTVQASAVMVETQSTGIGQVIDSRRIVELPLNGRDATQLIVLTGAAIEGRPTRTNYPGTAFPSIAGGTTGSVAFAVDGGTHNDPLSNGNLPLPFPDALQEFKVETSSLPAMYGYHSAGAVNAVTKSGTNTISGSLFEFFRHDRFNAKAAFALEKEKLQRNQFGGTAGGPIIADRLFYFGAYQGTVQRSISSFTATVPNEAMLRGDFSGITSPACRTAGQLNLPAALGFTGNRIDPARLHPIAINIARSYLPIAQANECGVVRYTGHAPNNNPTEHQVVGRVDFQMSARQALFVRFFNTHLDTPIGDPLENELLISTTGQTANVASLVVGHTLAGRNLVSQFRATGNRNSQTIKVPSYFTWPEVGVQNIYAVGPPDYPKFISGLTVGAGPAGFNLGSTPSRQPYQTFQLSEDLSMTAGGGAHQINFGGNWIDLRAYAVNEINRNGGFNFGGARSGGLALADFLLGLPSTFTQTAPVISNQRQTILGAYVQDVWRMNQRFTANAGLRWDPMFAHEQPLDVAYYISEEALQRGIKSTRFPNAPAGTLFRGDPGGPTGKRYYNNKLLNFSPRVGVVFDPAGDGRMSVRAGYGLMHEIPSMAYDQFGFARPLGMQVTRNNPLFEDPWQGFAGGNPFPRVIGQLGADAEWPFPGILTISYKPDTRNPYIHQWNLSVERQVQNTWLVSAAYLGNRTIHLWADYNPNPTLPLAITGPCVIGSQTFNPCAANPVTGAPVNVEARRRLNVLNPVEGRFYGTVGILDDGGTAYYNGLVLSARGRFGELLNVTSNFTWSDCVTDPYTTGLGIAGNQYSQPDNRRADRGKCIAHRDKVFNFTVLTGMPQFERRAMQLLAGDWRLAMSGRIMSGTWFNATTGVDRALSATPNQRPLQVMDDVYASDKSADLWLNPAAFAQPALGTFSDIAVNNLLGPKNIQFDLALTRLVNLAAHRVELRAEAFNILNIVNLANPNANLNSPDFGKIHVGTTGQAGTPRILQFALKYLF